MIEYKCFWTVLTGEPELYHVDHVVQLRFSCKDIVFLAAPRDVVQLETQCTPTEAYCPNSPLLYATFVYLGPSEELWAMRKEAAMSADGPKKSFIAWCAAHSSYSRQYKLF